MSKPCFTLVDVLVLAMACLMLLAVGTPVVVNARENASAIKCHGNL